MIKITAGHLWDGKCGRKTVFIGQIPILIVGVVETPPQNIEGQRATIWLPYNTVVSRLYNQSYFQQITVQVKEHIAPELAEKAIIDLLTIQHGRKDFFTFSSRKFYNLFSARPKR